MYVPVGGLLGAHFLPRLIFSFIPLLFVLYDTYDTLRWGRSYSGLFGQAFVFSRGGVFAFVSIVPALGQLLGQRIDPEPLQPPAALRLFFHIHPRPEPALAANNRRYFSKLYQLGDVHPSPVRGVAVTS